MERREPEPNVVVDAADVPPPIELDTLVPCAPDAAFAYFTRDISKWWPLSRYSCSEARASDVSFRGRDGGQACRFQPGRRFFRVDHRHHTPGGLLRDGLAEVSGRRPDL